MKKKCWSPATLIMLPGSWTQDKYLFKTGPQCGPKGSACCHMDPPISSTLPSKVWSNGACHTLYLDTSVIQSGGSDRHRREFCREPGVAVSTSITEKQRAASLDDKVASELNVCSAIISLGYRHIHTFPKRAKLCRNSSVPQKLASMSDFGKPLGGSFQHAWRFVEDVSMAVENKFSTAGRKFHHPWI